MPVIWALVVHAAQPVGASPGTVAAAEPMVDVQRLIGPAACTRDADCRSAPVGRRACGGPDQYVAWSVRRTDEAALNAALARETVRQATQVLKDDMRSTCVFVADPGARCMTTQAAEGSDGAAAVQRCVLGSGGGASAR